jgi:hypothetical protein
LVLLVVVDQISDPVPRNFLAVERGPVATDRRFLSCRQQGQILVADRVLEIGPVICPALAPAARGPAVDSAIESATVQERCRG